ncbi:MAG: Fic family protein [Rickettsiales bacterium]|jgi:fido (protein-threonine AMPylation protein)|nr:Fic family protein [Rickettsiales bacterium]
MDNFSEYKKIGEPDKKVKLENWRVAIGLQQVDGLTPSKYLIEIAKDNIDGKISIEKAEKQIKTYYKKNPPKTNEEKERQEADEVSSRITKLLSKKSFSFSPAELVSIHKYLFTGILDKKTAGKFRKYDISKNEPVLNGDSVSYGRADSIKETLDYDFKQEKSFDYSGLTKRKKAEHVAKFMSGIWQIHPFGEGNTRTVAVFIIKYLRTIGFGADNVLFEKYSAYFRNALVRANYKNLELGVSENMEYLNKFFGNFLLGENNKLDNKDLFLEVKNTPRKHLKKHPKKTRDKILELIVDKPEISMAEMATVLGLSFDTIRDHIDRMKSKNILRRIGPDKGGKWRIL